MTVVRVGSSLVAISSVFSLTPAEIGAIAAFIPLAVKQVESDRPDPVDPVS